jgi:hypothetical protein
LQLYHSIHARGEDVDEVLARAEREGVDAAADIDIERNDESMDIEDDADKAAAEEHVSVYIASSTCRRWTLT